MSESKVEEDTKVPFKSMLFVSNQIYAVASLRKIVRRHDETHGDKDNKLPKVPLVDPDLIMAFNERDGVVNADKSDLAHPISGKDIVEFVEKNRKYLEFSSTGAVSFNEAWDQLTEDEVNALEMPPFATGMLKFDADVWEFDDKLGSRDLVYGIVVNRTDKRIVIVFRGSVTKKDWKKSLEMFGTRSKHLTRTVQDRTRVQKFLRSGKHIVVHAGISKYVYKNNKHRNQSKFEDILGDLEDIYKYRNEEKGRDYSNYSLYVTGHSLGGALAQLVSFGLAARSQTEKKLYNYPVNCVSFASPRVGQTAYAKVSEELERHNLLNHIRVTTDQDIITAGPWLFKHVGINVHLYDKKNPKIAYKKNRSFFAQLGKKSIMAHGILEYRKRLREKSEFLDKSMKEFYRDYANMNIHETLP